MDRPSDKRFDIYFAGECLPGQEPKAVRAAVQVLFKADIPTIERLFSGKQQRIKRNCDENTARQYVNALRKAGATALVVPCEMEPAPAPEEGSPVASNQALSLAPVGSDVLTPAERPKSAVVNVATDHMSLANLDSGLEATAAPATGAVANKTVASPGYEVAPVGSVMDQSPRPVPPAAPDTSGITLDREEFDLSDCAPATAKPLDLDLDRLTLADTGENLLEAGRKFDHAARVPDISHLAVELDDNTDT